MIIHQPKNMDKDQFAEGLVQYNPKGVLSITQDRIENGKKILRCEWDDSVMPPSNDDLVSAATSARAKREDKKQSRDAAVDVLTQNAETIKQAMLGIADAQAALDKAIPVDREDEMGSVQERQAAVLFLAANALRAAMLIADGKGIPQSIIDEFLE